MTQQPTHPATLADLMLFAKGASELDALKNYVELDRPQEKWRLADLVARMHLAIERIAGPDANQIYAPDDGALLEN